MFSLINQKEHLYLYLWEIKFAFINNLTFKILVSPADTSFPERTFGTINSMELEGMLYTKNIFGEILRQTKSHKCSPPPTPSQLC